MAVQITCSRSVLVARDNHRAVPGASVGDADVEATPLAVPDQAARSSQPESSQRRSSQRDRVVRLQLRLVDRVLLNVLCLRSPRVCLSKNSSRSQSPSLNLIYRFG